MSRDALCIYYCKVLLSLFYILFILFIRVQILLAFFCIVCRDTSGRHTQLSPHSLLPSCFLSLAVKVMANDHRNRCGSSLGCFCSLERFQWIGPPKPTNGGDGQRLSSHNQYDIAKCPLIEPYGVQKRTLCPPTLPPPPCNTAFVQRPKRSSGCHCHGYINFYTSLRDGLAGQ